MRTLFCISFILALTACNSHCDKTKQLSNNIAIFFDDNSLNKENPSLQLSIDNNQIFQTDSITKAKRQDFEIKMDTGRHIIYVQTLEKQFGIADTITITKVNQRYLLSIRFNYNPPTDWFIDYTTRQTYSKTLIHNKLNPDTTIRWLMDSLTRQIERENKTSTLLYKPNDRHFEIEFEEQPILE